MANRPHPFVERVRQIFALGVDAQKPEGIFQHLESQKAQHIDLATLVIWAILDVVERMQALFVG
jgi:hypothetical protein